MEIFLNDVFYVASLSQFTISLTLQSAYILNGAKWVGHPPGKNFYDYFHDFVIVMHLIGCKIRLCRNYSVTNLGLLFIPDTRTQLQSINHLTT